MTQPVLPCSDEEWNASLDALNRRRLDLEEARIEYQGALDRVRRNLISLGVVPEEL